MSDYSDGFWLTMGQLAELNARRERRTLLQRETVARIRASLDAESLLPQPEISMPPSTSGTPSPPPSRNELGIGGLPQRRNPRAGGEWGQSIRAKVRASMER